MTEPVLIAHDSRDGMADSLAERVAGVLSEAVARRGQAGLIVSGGSTPKPLFERLSRADLAWPKVTITLADERWVPPESEGSNARLLREVLLQHDAAAATFLPLASAGASPEEDAASAETRLDAFPWPADITILGMGTDGHTASWFPGASQLAAALDPEGERRCLALTPEPLPAEAPYPRLTLTLPAILASRRLLVMLSGADKRSAYERAAAAGETMEMPVRAVLRQERVPLELHWAP